VKKNFYVSVEVKGFAKAQKLSRCPATGYLSKFLKQKNGLCLFAMVYEKQRVIRQKILP